MSSRIVSVITSPSVSDVPNISITSGGSAHLGDPLGRSERCDCARSASFASRQPRCYCSIHHGRAVPGGELD